MSDRTVEVPWDEWQKMLSVYEKKVEIEAYYEDHPPIRIAPGPPTEEGNYWYWNNTFGEWLIVRIWKCDTRGLMCEFPSMNSRLSEEDGAIWSEMIPEPPKPRIPDPEE